MTSLISIILAAAGSIGAYFAWKSSAVRQRRAAEKKVDAERRAFNAMRSEIEKAVYNRDDDKVNQIVSRLLAPIMTAAICAAALCACRSAATATVYVPTDRRIESTTNSIGIACKAVPDAVFAEMLVRLQEYDDLRRETKIDKRLAK